MPSMNLRLTDEDLAVLREHASRAEMSLQAYLRDAALRRAREEDRLAERLAAGREFAELWEAIHGPIPDAARAEARQALAEAGLLPGNKAAC